MKVVFLSLILLGGAVNASDIDDLNESDVMMLEKNEGRLKRRRPDDRDDEMGVKRGITNSGKEKQSIEEMHVIPPLREKKELKSIEDKLDEVMARFKGLHICPRIIPQSGMDEEPIILIFDEDDFKE